MSIDLIIQSGTKFALHQWLDARDLGDNVQDTDATSPTFGDYFYTHRVGSFLYWNHPSGVVTKDSAGNVFAGFFARLSFPDNVIPSNLKTWVETSTATSVLDGVAGVGGEGITILDPEDLRAAVVAGGAPLWDGILGISNQWSTPELWAFQNVMTGDRRDFGTTTYESTIDFNVWTPTQFPGGWIEIGPVDPGTDEWAVGVAYQVGDVVIYEGAEYECRQAHTSIAPWTPPAVLSLWLPL